MIFSHPGELFIGKGADFTASIYAVIAICILLMIEVYQEFLRDRFRVGLLSSQIARMTVYGFVVILILYLGVFGHGQFIYFQF